GPAPDGGRLGARLLSRPPQQPRGVPGGVPGQARQLGLRREEPGRGEALTEGSPVERSRPRSRASTLPGWRGAAGGAPPRGYVAGLVRVGRIGAQVRRSNRSSLISKPRSLK